MKHDRSRRLGGVMRVVHQVREHVKDRLDLIGFTEPVGPFSCRVTEVGYLGG